MVIGGIPGRIRLRQLVLASPVRGMVKKFWKRAGIGHEETQSGAGWAPA